MGQPERPSLQRTELIHTSSRLVSAGPARLKSDVQPELAALRGELSFFARLPRTTGPTGATSPLPDLDPKLGQCSALLSGEAGHLVDHSVKGGASAALIILPLLLNAGDALMNIAPEALSRPGASSTCFQPTSPAVQDQSPWCS